MFSSLSGDWTQPFTRKKVILESWNATQATGKKIEFTVLQENLPCRPWNFFQEKKYFLKLKKKSNQVRWLSNSHKKQKCIDELKWLFTPCPEKQFFFCPWDMAFQTTWWCAIVLLPKNHQYIQISTETAYYEQTRLCCECRDIYPEEITYFTFIWFKKQTKTKTKPQYLYASVIILDKYIFTFDF